MEMPEHRRCPVCGGDDNTFLLHPPSSPGPIARCTSCGMIYIAELERTGAIIAGGPVLHDEKSAILDSVSLDDVAHCWEMQFLPHKEREWPAIRRNAIEAFDRLQGLPSSSGSVSNQARILDFGCGWGFAMLAAKERGWQPYGIDPLPACAVYARHLTGGKVITDTLHRNSFPEDYFDYIISLQVFEHLLDPLGDLQLLSHMLKKDGLLLIEVPNFDTWSVSLLGKRHRHFVRDHINFFSLSTLTRLVEQVRLESVGSYFPTRNMTLGYLVQVWLALFMPGSLVQPLNRFMSGLRLQERVIRLNLHDIIAIIARKAV